MYRTNYVIIVIQIGRVIISRKGLRMVNTEVEFYLVDSFEIFHFEPFYYELRKRGVNAVFVAEPWEINTSGKWFDSETSINILEEHGFEYRTECDPNCKCALTTQGKHILRKYKNAVKIQLLYGTNFYKKVQFQISESANDLFDFCFVNGRYYVDKFHNVLKNDKVVDVSYPKHRGFFKKGITKDDVVKELHINTKKPILVYYPTWDEYNSIQVFGDEINKLRNDFFVVTKAHHCTYRLKSKKEDLKKLYEISDIVLEGNYDFAKTTVLGDVILCDSKSAASTEIPFLNKKAKMVELFTIEKKEDYDFPIDEFYCVCEKPTQLREKVYCVLEKDMWEHSREKIIDYIYSEDIEAGLQRGIKTILDCI